MEPEAVQGHAQRGPQPYRNGRANQEWRRAFCVLGGRLVRRASHTSPHCCRVVALTRQSLGQLVHEVSLISQNTGYTPIVDGKQGLWPASAPPLRPTPIWWASKYRLHLKTRSAPTATPVPTASQALRQGHNISNVHISGHARVHIEDHYSQDLDDERISQWLSPFDPWAAHREAHDQFVPGTFVHFFNSPGYKSWKDGEK